VIELNLLWHSIDDTNLFTCRKKNRHICPIDDEPDAGQREQSEAEATTNERVSTVPTSAAAVLVVACYSAMVIALRIVKVRRDTQFVAIGRSRLRLKAWEKEDNSWESFDLSLCRGRARYAESRHY
jgi:hypothetical protein